MWFTFALVGVALFAFTGIIDSILVKQFEKNPFVLGWYISLFTFPVFAVLALLFDVRTSWMFLLTLLGLIAACGNFLYFHIVRRFDISVVNITFAVLAVYLSAAGFLLFDEIWTVWQILGVCFAIAGIFILAYWHKHVSILYTLLLFGALAALWAPSSIGQKAALFHGERVLVAFFWPLLGREIAMFLFPFFVPSVRKSLCATARRVAPSFYLVCLIGQTAFFTGFYLTNRAYEVGPVSLVGVVSNIQPFFVILFAWFVSRAVPAYAPRELLTAQSIQVKLTSFAVVFIGLALLAVE